MRTVETSPVPDLEPPLPGEVMDEEEESAFGGVGKIMQVTTTSATLICRYSASLESCECSS